METYSQYTIAYRLKKAGFPQTAEYDEILYGPDVTFEDVAFLEHGKDPITPKSIVEEQTAILPSTDALIDLLREDSVITITSGKADTTALHGMSGIISHGKTPKLALINLYLALHGNY